MTKLWKWLMVPPTDGSPAFTLIRMMAGTVFLWEGILKFVYANQGVGRFTKLGFPAPASNDRTRTSRSPGVRRTEMPPFPKPRSILPPGR